MIHYIYKIHFLCGFPSGRYYIGRHTHKGMDLSTDKYTGSGNFCKSYFKKYGKKEGITYLKEILEINPSKQVNLHREKIVIGDLWKTDPLCMNQCIGGIGVEKDTHVYEKVIQFDLLGNIIKIWDSIVTAEQSLGISNIKTVCIGEKYTAGKFIWRFVNDPFDKYPIPDIVHANIKRRKKVVQYSIDGKFIKLWNSTKESAEHYSNSKRASDWLQEAISGKAISWHGYIWRRYNGSTKDILVERKPSLRRRILQYSLDNRLINNYNSASEAAHAVKGDATNILRCANGKYKKSYGYKWKYE